MWADPSVSALRELMRRVVDDPEDARARAAAARARVVSRYSQAAVADLWSIVSSLSSRPAEREKERDEEEARERAEAERRRARGARGGFGGGFGAEDYKSGYRMREALGWSRGRGSDYGDLHDSDPLMRPRLHADSDDDDALARLRPVKLPHLGSHADEHGRHSDELWRAVLSDPDWPYDAVPPPPMTSPPFDGGLVDGGGEWGGEQSSWGPTLDEYADGVNGIWVREVWREIDRWLPGAGRLRGWSDRIRRTFGGAAGEPPPELVVRPTEREEEAASSGGWLGAGYFAPPATATAPEVPVRAPAARRAAGGGRDGVPAALPRAVDGGARCAEAAAAPATAAARWCSPSPPTRSPSSPSAGAAAAAAPARAARPHRDALRRRRRDAAAAGRRRRRPARRRRRARQRDGVARPRRQRLRRRRPRVRGERAGAPRRLEVEVFAIS